MALVQTAFNTNIASGQTTVTVSLPNTVAGNTIIVGIGWGSDTATPTVADNVNAGNYAGAGTLQTGVNGNSTGIYYKSNITGGSIIITLTLSLTQTNGLGIFAYEFSAVQLSAPVDQSNSSSDPTTTAISSGAITTTNANDLLFAMTCCGNGPATGAAGWTSQNDPFFVGAEYQLVTSTGTYTATFTQAGTAPWACSISSFKVSAGTPTAVEALAAHSALVGTSMINRRTTDAVASGLSGVLTAKHIANANVTI